VAREGVLTMINPAMSSPTSTPSSNRFWTVERMRQARPIPLPMVLAPQLATPALLQPSPDRQSRDAVAPAVLPQPMMTPGRLRVERAPAAGPTVAAPGVTAPTMVAQPGYPFTSSRVPLGVYFTWPYYLTGILFFTDSPGQPYSCSGSVIGRRWS
jgi:hypothetical protein